MRRVSAAGLDIGGGAPPRVMGVLNVSRESPYDPSVFEDAGAAAAYVDETLVAEGADVVDVGLESANKRFEVLSAEAELDRLDTAVETLASVSGDPVFSIETRYSEVAEAALARGFDMVNDVCGFADPRMPEVCAEYDAAVVKMASPPDLERPGALDSVDEIYDALERGGLTEKTIVDPAFGGWSETKTLADDRETFRRLREFQAIGQPVLVSINRKNFLRELAGRSTEAALPVSLAATAMAVDRGADIVRTHDVSETRDAVLVGDAFARDRLRDADCGLVELDVTTVQEARRHLESAGDQGTADALADGRADPTAAVCRAVAVTGPSDEVRARLARLARDHGVTAAAGGDRLVLAGPLASLHALGEAAAAGTEPPRVERIATKLTELGR